MIALAETLYESFMECRAARGPTASPRKGSHMNWGQYLKIIVFVIVAAFVAFPVLEKSGVLVVLAVLYILCRLWLVGPHEDRPPA